MSSKCPNCGVNAMDPFYEVNSVPTNSCILLETEAEAKAYTRGDMRMEFCNSCGFIANMAFDQKLTEYSGRYEETQGFSGTFNKFHKQLAEQLIERYDLHQKHIVEIGCGKGAFLNMVCELGNNSGAGFDPGYKGDRTDTTEAANVKFVSDFYSEKYIEEHGDFIACKMTLEHIPQTYDFINTVNRSIADKENAVIFFMVPESIRIFRDCAYEDIYYEHVSYFTSGSLARLFEKNDFGTLRLATEYDEQYLSIEARPKESGAAFIPSPDDLSEVAGYVDTFNKRCSDTINEWKETVGSYLDNGKKVIMWGSGSKGVAFLKSLGELGDRIEYVVDINPYRQGYYMSGTGQKIIGPDFLKSYKPDAVIVMNRIYCDEIGQDLAKMGLHPEIKAL